MRNVRGEGEHPWIQPPRNEASGTEGGIPFDWLDAGKSKAGNLRFPLHTMEWHFFFFLSNRLYSSDPAVAQSLPARNTAHFLSRRGWRARVGCTCRSVCAGRCHGKKNKNIRVCHNHPKVAERQLRRNSTASDLNLDWICSRLQRALLV